MGKCLYRNLPTKMRVLIQRVTSAKVYIGNKIVGEIGKGYLILLGVKEGDYEGDSDVLAEKTVNLRIMSDAEDRMNLSILDVNGEILVVSQFTLYADTGVGRRPSFIKAGKPERAKILYESFIKKLKDLGVRKVATGEFGAYMNISLVNDGPVTIMLESGGIKVVR